MISPILIKAEAARLRTRFEAQGAQVVEPPILQPAEVLLDLYGEDIRARAYVTSDALRGEQMLRPDFTVPVVQMHMAHGAEPARYTYAGEVFRRQELDAGRPNEYLQVGYEVFDRENPSQADAEVFCVIADALAEVPVRASIGDIGILMAAVEGLHTSQVRRAALMRHIWRPRRFRALIERFAGRVPSDPQRIELLLQADPMAQAGAEIGLRSRAAVLARLDALRTDLDSPAISAGEVELLDALLSVRETAPYALEHLSDIAVDLPSIAPAVARFEARLDAMAARGVDIAALEFEASFGRTSMEYYDGFVFGFYATDRSDLPPVATGGRYDALTRVLGQGAEIPAVGGVIIPERLMAMRGEA